MVRRSKYIMMAQYLVIYVLLLFGCDEWEGISKYVTVKNVTEKCISDVLDGYSPLKKYIKERRPNGAIIYTIDSGPIKGCVYNPNDCRYITSVMFDAERRGNVVSIMSERLKTIEKMTKTEMEKRRKIVDLLVKGLKSKCGKQRKTQ